jgi:NAD(P)-dependent dehydrogenase (short-subunit alcohol dehydrogenase family)
MGRTVLVTGGASGIGRETVLAFARRGDTVFACDRDADGLATLAATAVPDGLSVVPLAADVRSEADIVRAVAHATEESGRVDVLVNAAGIAARPDGDVRQRWQECLDVNLTAPYLFCHHAFPHMRERGGAIVSVSSVQAFVAPKGAAAYVASKGGLNALTRALAIEYAEHGIRVNCICPAAIDTPLLRRNWRAARPDTDPDELKAEIERGYPLGRIGTPADCAHLICFLAGPEADFITGQSYAIDGGLLARLPVGPQK